MGSVSPNDPLTFRIEQLVGKHVTQIYIQHTLLGSMASEQSESNPTHSHTRAEAVPGSPSEHGRAHQMLSPREKLHGTSVES